MKEIKVRYISDLPSIYFKKGEIYTGHRLLRYPNLAVIAFYFTEEEMDEEGYYCLPASRFEVVKE